MGRVLIMNVKAKCAMDHFTNMGYRVDHIRNTSFGGIPFKEIAFINK